MQMNPQKVMLTADNGIKLPTAILRQAHIYQNTWLNVDVQNGKIVLTPSKSEEKKPFLMDYFGATRGLYGDNKSQIDDYIAQERASWE